MQNEWSTLNNRKNPEHHVVAAIRRLRTDKKCPAKTYMAKPCQKLTEYRIEGEGGGEGGEEGGRGGGVGGGGEGEGEGEGGGEGGGGGGGRGGGRKGGGLIHSLNRSPARSLAHSLTQAWFMRRISALSNSIQLRWLKKGFQH